MLLTIKMNISLKYVFITGKFRIENNRTSEN